MESTKNIVIVEDNKDMTDALCEALEGSDRVCHVTHSGDDAARLAEEVGADIVLLDMMLPGTTGEFVLQEIRQVSALENIPVMVLTNFSEAGSLRTQAQEDDRLHYFVKAQTDLDVIVNKVQELLVN